MSLLQVQIQKKREIGICEGNDQHSVTLTASADKGKKNSDNRLIL